MIDYEKEYKSSIPYLYKYIGIRRQAELEFGLVIIKQRILDIFCLILWFIGLYPDCPDIISESFEDFYVRRLYHRVEDCFSRPLLGPAGGWINVGLRKLENDRLVLTDKSVKALNYGSYNYLGFGGTHKRITQEVVDSLYRSNSYIPGTPLENKISKEQQELEKLIAKFLGKEDALVIPMGFATNSTTIPFIVGKNDVVISDKLNHSSLITGIRMTGAEIKVFGHNDLQKLHSILEDLKLNGMSKGENKGKQPGKVLLVIEGLYSMEGEFCPLKEIVALKKKYGFYIFMDEAHSIGALGATGRGICEHLGVDFNDIDIHMGTFTKSFASTGGYIASNKTLIDRIRHNSYAYVYGPIMSPPAVQQIISAFKTIETEEGKQKIKQLRENSIYFREEMKKMGCHVLGNKDSPVIPVMGYNPNKIVDFSKLCLKLGMAVVIVSAPATPLYLSRIRFCMSASHSTEDVKESIEKLKQCVKFTGIDFNNHTKEVVIQEPKMMTLEEIEKIDSTPRQMTPLENIDAPQYIEEIEMNDNLKYLSNTDVHNFRLNKDLQNAMAETIKIYGCGSCGPRGFYGGTKVHFELEEDISKFFGTENTIIYSYGFSVASSVIPVYAHDGDVIVIDEKCNYSLQLGCILSKKLTLRFKHNDVEDMRAKIKEARKSIKSSKLNKVILVTEGTFQCDLSIAPLKEFIKRKERGGILLIVDDTIGIGNLGATLRGTTEQEGVNLKDIDVLIGTLENTFAGMGGFATGSYEVISKQRLAATGYTFSASQPPYTCTNTSYIMNNILKNEKAEEFGIKLRENRQKFQDKIEKLTDKFEFKGDVRHPYVYILPKNGDIFKLQKHMSENGLYCALTHHIESDLCKGEEYMKLVISNDITEDDMNNIVNALSSY